MTFRLKRSAGGVGGLIVGVGGGGGGLALRCLGVGCLHHICPECGG